MVLREHIKALRRFLGPMVASMLGLLAVGLCLWVPSRAAGVLLGAALLAGSWWRARARRRARVPVARSFAWVALAVAAAPTSPMAALVMLGIVAFELVVQAGDNHFAPRVAARNLPGVRRTTMARAAGHFSAPAAALAVLAAPLLIFDLALGYWAGLAVLVMVGTSFVAVRDWRAWRAGSITSALAAAVATYDPAILVHYAGPPAGLYQITMWLGLLEGSGWPVAVVVRQRSNLEVIGGATRLPVVLAPKVQDLAALLSDGVRAIAYVNNDARNADVVRFTNLVHLQLGHGDSDKPSSYTKQFGMYDKVLLAGQAGVDRFAEHGVVIEPSKFEIVGLPQLADVQSAGRTQVRRVLYAPTWRSGVADMQFGSLSFGKEIVQQLLDLGMQVHFRPHPYSSRDAGQRALVAEIDALLMAAGSPHQTSAQTKDKSLTDCFNASDALVCDVSAVLTSYLASEKPMSVTNMIASEHLQHDYPVSAAAYELRPGVGPRPILELMLGSDPLAPERRRLRRYYLGDFPQSESIARFQKVLRAAINPARD